MKKSLTLALSTAVALGALSGAAFAQQSAKTPFYEFKIVDMNHDNIISLDEAQAKAPDVTLGQYLSADSDSDGKLSQDEFAIAMKLYQKNHQ